MSETKIEPEPISEPDPTVWPAPCAQCGSFPSMMTDRFCGRCGRGNPDCRTPAEARRWFQEVAALVNQLARQNDTICSVQTFGWLLLLAGLLLLEPTLSCVPMNPLLAVVGVLAVAGPMMLIVIPLIMVLRWELPMEVEILRRVGYDKRCQRLIWLTLGIICGRYNSDLKKRFKNAGYKIGLFFCDLKQFEEKNEDNSPSD